MTSHKLKFPNKNYYNNNKISNKTKHLYNNNHNNNKKIVIKTPKNFIE